MIAVLVIDDDPSISQVLSSSLNKEEFKMDIVTSGLRGFHLAQKTKPDIVILDQILPDMMGNEILAMFKDDPLTKHIPIVIFSAYPNDAVRELAMKNGALNFVPKNDIDPATFGEKIKEYLKQARGNIT